MSVSTYEMTSYLEISSRVILYDRHWLAVMVIALCRQRFPLILACP